MKIDAADMIVFGAKVTTLEDHSLGDATALAVRGERFVAVGGEADVMRWRGEHTRVIDADGRRVIPGLNDSHMHAVRGGLLYNLELRWDGVATLERGLEMIAQQAQRTPAGQWVRVMGGWSPFQFVETRMPSVSELNEAAPDTPVLVLFAYSEVILNRAAVEQLELARPDNQTASGRYEFIDGGAIVTGSAAVYATIAKLPPLTDLADRINSTQNFLHELNRFGLTSTVDAGESATTYPDDYKALQTLASRPGFPVRISNFLFAQKPGMELEAWTKWTAEEAPGINQAASRLNGYVLQGAGEVVVWDAHDFENFMEPRPEWDEGVEAELTRVTRVIAAHQWPIRMHATYDETITRILDVFERVFEETGLHGPLGDRSRRNHPAGEHREDQGDGRWDRRPEPARVLRRILRRALRPAGGRGGLAATPAARRRDTGRRWYGRDPTQQLQPLAFAVLDGDRQEHRWNANRGA